MDKMLLTERSPKEPYVRTIATVLTLSTVAALLGACAAPSNTRSTIGAGWLGDASQRITLDAVRDDAPPVSLTDAGPSVTGLDRTSWARHEMLIPNDHTEHHPHFTGLASWTGVDYSGAAYPTLETALSEEFSASSGLVEWVAWPLKLVRDDIGSIRQLGDSKALLNYSPRYDTYERTPSE